MRTYSRTLRSVALAATGAVSIGVITAFGAAGAQAKAATLKPPAKPVTLNYVGAAYSAAALVPVFKAFEKAYPTIKIKYQSVPQPQLTSVIQNRISGSSIDVFDVDMPRLQAYNERGWLYNLTPVFGNLKGQVDPKSIDATTLGGKLLAMPLQTSEQLLYYNKALLKKAGISDPTSAPGKPLTWQTVAAEGAKAQKSAGAKYGLVFDQLDAYYQLQPLPMSLGGSAGATGKGNLTPDITSKPWVTAMTWYGNLYAKGIAPRGVQASETPTLFANGETAFFVGGPWWAPEFEGAKNLAYGVAAMPYFKGGKVVTPTGAWSLGINKNSKNIAADEIFLKWMGLHDGGFSQYITDLAVPPSNIAGAKKYYKSKSLTNPNMKGAAKILQFELTHSATTRLKTVGYIEFESIMTTAYDDIINGTPASSALQTASQQLAAAWAKYK